MEEAQILAYAWNSAPMAEAGMLRSLTAVGRELQFPIDFIDNDINMESTPASKNQYTTDLKFRLSKCREVYKVLIDEHMNIHREYVNASRPNPSIYEVGNHVWARRQN